MKTQEKLIAAALAAFPTENETEIARRAGLTIARFSNYKKGIRKMDDDAIIGMAELVGWDVKKTLAAHHIEIAATPRERAFWRQLGAAAALAVVALLPTGNANAVTADLNGFKPYALCEVSLSAALPPGQPGAVFSDFVSFRALIV